MSTRDTRKVLQRLLKLVTSEESISKVNLMVMSPFQGEEELSNNDVEEVDMWEESYGGHQDSKPKGPTAVAVDFTFAGMS